MPLENLEIKGGVYDLQDPGYDVTPFGFLLIFWISPNLPGSYPVARPTLQWPHLRSSERIRKGKLNAYS